ncbi:MAG: T9SS type A sorting domain-containing protein [Bacteroidia bacterium]|nr:T9SS type A sorting domain-containing protein [Bacteroidia bacterium]
MFADASPILCNGGMSTVTLTGQGGTSPYHYANSFFDVFLELSEPAGFYDYPVTDAHGCTASTQITVTQPSFFDVFADASPIMCNGGMSTVTLTGQGGTSPYHYANSFFDVFTEISLPAGPYSFTVTDANGCIATTSITITEPDQLSVYIESLDVTCFDACDGRIMIYPSGGVLPYNIVVNGTPVNISTGYLMASDACAGQYYIQVFDANGCEYSQTVNIHQPPALQVSVQTTPILCNGGMSTASITIQGGVYGYDTEMLTASGVPIPAADISGNGTGNVTAIVSAGIYTIHVTDANGCIATTQITVTEPSFFDVFADASPIMCNGGMSTVTLTGQGGTSPYHYANSFFDVFTEISLPAGPHILTVTDANGCTATTSITITEPTVLSASANATTILCNGGTSTVTVSATGGTTPYNGTGIFVKTAGTYNFTVTDANGCTAIASIIITEPYPLGGYYSFTDVTCYGSADGTIDFYFITGGIPPYEYSIDGGSTWQTTGNFTGLGPDNYNFVIRDANNCMVSGVLMISQPAPLEINSTVSWYGSYNISNYGASDGWIDITATGGTAPYTYYLNGLSNTTGYFDDLSAGGYYIAIVDANGCSNSSYIYLTQPEYIILNAELASQNVSCFGACDGWAHVTVTSGTPPYNFIWSNGATTEDLSGLCPGVYTVTITDALSFINPTNVSEVVLNVTITQPGPLAVYSSVTDVLCFGSSTGSIYLTVTGGTYPYSFYWSNGFTTQNLMNLSAGNYSVTVYDSHQCAYNGTYTIMPPPPQLIVTGVVTNVDCNDQSNGSVILTVSGGKPPYSFSWSNGSTTQNLNNLSAGNYSVTVIDSNLCTNVQTFTVTQPSPVSANLSSTNVSCFGNCDGSITVIPSGGTPPYLVSYNGVQISAAPYQFNGLCAGTHTVVVTDSKGCSNSYTITITQPTELIANATFTTILCNGGTSTVTVTATGGTAPYNGTGTFVVSAGTYNYTVTDHNGCQASASVTITQPELLTASSTATAILCNGSTSTVMVSATGGTTPYNGAGNFIKTAGTYSFTITDANGCIATTSITITEPATLVAASSATTILCHGDISTVTVSATGGTLPYTGTGIFNESAGTYSYSVTDANGCIANTSITITEPSLLSASASSTTILCHGDTSTVTVTATGGTTPYNGTGIFLKTEGIYSFTITDANGCTAIKTVVITQPDPLTVAGDVHNVSCHGGNDGSINLTVTGGVPPYNYIWSNGQTNEDLFNLTAGVYSVTVYDSHQCSVHAEFLITEPLPIVISGVVTNVNCNGGNNGAIDITVTGGVPPYLYIWSNGESTEDISGLTAGFYSITVIDSKGCEAMMNFQVTEPEPMGIQAVVTNVSCPGGNDGSIDITVYGGTPPYSYMWSNGQTTEDIYGLTFGNYSVQVTDAKGCSYSMSFVITEPQQISVYGDVQNVLCHNGNEGSVFLSVYGGVPPYTYVWSNGMTSGHITGLTAGSYSVTVSDSHHCVAYASFVVTQPDPLIITGVVNEVTCYGAQNGSIDITVTGGTYAPPALGYEMFFIWSNGSTNANNINLGPGNYTVTVIDAFGCIATTEFTITEPDPLAMQYVVGNVSCAGGTNGSITLTVSGGTLPYSYYWSNGATTKDIYNLGGGYYSVTITDANGCMLIHSFYLPVSVVLQLTANVSNVVCAGTASGTIDLSVSGGISPLIYLWSNGATTQDLSGITAGTYSVTVTDNIGCYATASYNVGTANLFTVTGVKTAVSCYGSSDGAITITVVGANPPFTYLWSNGATTKDISGLTAGNYIITVTQYYGCFATASFTITQPAAIVLTGVVTNVSCFGGNPNGGIALTVQNNFPPYSYYWSNGSTVQSPGNLSAGNYSVTVTNSHGCKAYALFTITQPSPISITFSVSNFNGYSVSGYGATNGYINTTITGGTPPYTYTWNNGSHTSYRMNVGAGNYSLNIIDAHGCSANSSVTLTQPAQLVIGQIVKSNYNGYNISCNGGNNGSATASASGGVTPYNFSWSTSPVQNSSMATGLTAGSYTVIITDANGNTASGVATLVQPAALSSSITFTNVTCSGANNGTITQTLSGGVNPYTFIWSNGATTKNVSNLAPGTYIVTITDSNGCILIKTRNIILLPQMVLSVTSVNPTCSNDGSAVLTITGGTSPFTYIWSNGATTKDLNNLGAGTYSVTVTSGSGCTAMISVTLTGNNLLSVYTAYDDVSCNGGSDGIIELMVNGGVPPYSFIWSNGATTQDLIDVVAGLYSVTVADSHNCVKTAEVTISQPQALDLNIVATNPTCYGASNGSIEANASGGVSPYTYYWSNGSVNAFISGVPAGSYSVIVTDANGCMQEVDNILLSQPTQINITAQLTMATCYKSENGVIDITVTGGTGPYTYSWSNFSTNEDATGLKAGNYIVMVTDANGCSIYSPVYVITEPSAISAATVVTMPTCNTSNNASIDLTLSGGVSPYVAYWSVSWLGYGPYPSNSFPVPAEDINNLSPGTYTLIAQDANGCYGYDTVIIVPPPTLAITLFKTDVTCYGNSNGSVGVVVSGGTYPYTFLWSNGISVVSTDENVNNIPAGTYYVTIADAQGCYTTANITVLQNPAIVITTSTTVSGGYAAVQANVSGGVPPYTYLWSNGSNNFKLKRVALGTVLTITVTDAYGCTATLTITVGSSIVNEITQPSVLTEELEPETVTLNEITSKELTFKVYPNPNKTGIFNLEFGNADPGKLIVQVYDMTGKLIYNREIFNPGDVNKISLNEFTSGVYYLKVLSANFGTLSKQLIITQ